MGQISTYRIEHPEELVGQRLAVVITEANRRRKNLVLSHRAFMERERKELKEKLLAAHRGGIKTVLIPEENVKDLVDIPDNIKNKLEIVPVKWIDKVLEIALERQPEPLPESEEPAPVPPKADDQTTIRPH